MSDEVIDVDLKDGEVEFVADDGSADTDELPSIEDLQKQLDETLVALKTANELNEELKGKVNNTDAIIKGFEKAADKMQQPVKEDASKEKEIDREALKQEFYDDPVTSSEKLLRSMFEDKANTMQESIIRVHLNNSRNSVSAELKALAEGYEDEVEQVIKATPPDLLIQYQNPYEAAYKRVIGEHVTEILNRNKGDGNSVQTRKQDKPFTEQNSVAPPDNGKKVRKVKLTSEMIAYGDMMEKRGIDRNEALRRKYGYGK